MSGKILLPEHRRDGAAGDGVYDYVTVVEQSCAIERSESTGIK